MVNKAIILGNLGKDPELRYTPSGLAIARFPVATNERWLDQSNQRQERTEWHNIVVFGKQAENCGQYLSKGRQVFVEGSIRTRSYEDKDGNKRYVTEIVARDVRFLGAVGAAGPGRAPDAGFVPPPGEDVPPPVPEEEDTPF